MSTGNISCITMIEDSHNEKQTWTSRQHTDRSVPGSSWSWQEPNSNHQSGKRCQHQFGHDLRWTLWSKERENLPGIVPCLREPSAERCRLFHQVPPVVYITVSTNHSFHIFFHFCLTKLPLAETTDPKWRSLWVPEVSVQVLMSGLYLDGDMTTSPTLIFTTTTTVIIMKPMMITT